MNFGSSTKAKRYKRKKKLKYWLLSYVQYRSRRIWGSIDRFFFSFFSLFFWNNSIICYMVILPLRNFYLFFQFFFCSQTKWDFSLNNNYCSSICVLVWSNEPVKDIHQTNYRVELVFMHTASYWNDYRDEFC